MPSTIPDAKRQDVIRLRQSGKTRDHIAKEVGIGTGTVSNIIRKFKNCHNAPDICPKYDPSKVSSKIRDERAPFAIAETDSTANSTTDSELKHYPSKSDNLKIVPPAVQADNKDLAGQERQRQQIPNLSKSEETRFIVIPYSSYERQKKEEMKMIDAEILQKREEKAKLQEDISDLKSHKERITHEVNDALQERTMTIKSIQEYARSNEELNKHGISTSDMPRLVRTLKNLKKDGYNIGKIIARASMIDTLENQEQGLKQRCCTLKTKGETYEEAFQTCEHLASFGVNIGQLELPALFDAIQEIASFYRTSLQESARLLFAELTRYTRTQERQREIAILDSLIIAKRFDLQALDNYCISRTAVGLAVSRLLLNGVTEQQIIHLDRLLVNNWDKVDLESFPGDLMKFGRIKYAIKQAEAELNILDQEKEKRERWINNAIGLLNVAETKDRPNPGFTNLKDSNLDMGYSTHEPQEIYDADGKLLSRK